MCGGAFEKPVGDAVWGVGGMDCGTDDRVCAEGVDDREKGTVGEFGVGCDVSFCREQDGERPVVVDAC